MEPRNRFQGMNSASLYSLAGRYDNSIPPWFLVPIDSLKIPALASSPEFRQGWAAFLLRWGPLSNSRVGSCPTQHSCPTQQSCPTQVVSAFLLKCVVTLRLRCGQLSYLEVGFFPTQGLAAALLKCRQLPNSSVAAFLLKYGPLTSRLFYS